MASRHSSAVLGISMLLALACGSAGAAEPQPDVLVGVNYFAGWWEQTPNKWQGPDGVDWRAKYPDRVPLLGEYNEQATMDREIAAAAEYGVDFFQILWYAADKEVRDTEHINVAVEQFMNSPQSHRMKFVVEYCNHPPFGISNPARWKECVDFWVKCLQHPSCLQVQGRRVFKIHGAGLFLDQCGKDVAQAKRFVDELRAAARQAGLGELLIGGGAVGPSRIGPEHWVTQLFDYTNEYMNVPDLPTVAQDYPFEKLGAFQVKWRAGHAEDAIPSVPYLGAGWNPRPWGDPRPSFLLPDRQQWKAALQALQADLNQGRLGFPGTDGKIQPAVTIYCWNEFGEGGIIAPTRGQQYMKLEVIREVFGAPKR
jgi:hypothetical protein